MTGDAWVLRPWSESDDEETATLLDLVYGDDLVAIETQAVHGAPRDEPGASSRTFVAVRDVASCAPVERVRPSARRRGPAAPARRDSLSEARAAASGEPREDAIFGVGTVFESAFAPARSRLSLQVHPGWRRRGIGTALLTNLARIAASRDTRPLQASIRADATSSLGFLAHHGFRHLMRTRLGTCAPAQTPTLGSPPTLASERLSGSAGWIGAVSPGRPHPPSPQYRIAPLPALTDLPGIIHKIATLHAEIYRQTHAWSPPAPITPTQAEAVFLGPDLIPDALFVALANDTPVGVASLRDGPTPGGIDLGWTGVLVGQPAAPEITAALLNRCLSYASERGWTITLEVDEADHILWHLLGALPVTWEPAWLNLERVSNPRTRT